MDTFLTQPLEHQRAFYEEAGRRLGLSAGSVEKDLWVCWTLRALFHLPVSGPHLTFKGGTSLSKGWKLIDRFSEDIDIVIDREFLGYGGANAPEDAASNKQRVKRLDALILAAQTHIRDALSPALEEAIRRLLPPEARWTLHGDSDDPDGQTLLFHYPTAMGAAAYVRPVVKIELGARSDTEPSATPTIAPYLSEVFPMTCPTPGSRCTPWHLSGRSGKGRPAARGDLPRGLERAKGPPSPPLLRPVVPHHAGRGRACNARSAAVQPCRRPPLRLLPTQSLRAGILRAGFTTNRPGGRPPRPLATRLRGHARIHVLR